MKGFISTKNRTSRNVGRKVRSVQPSLRTIGKWREEWIEKGLDHKMCFQSYKTWKCKKRAVELREKRLKNKSPNK